MRTTKLITAVFVLFLTGTLSVFAGGKTEGEDANEKTKITYVYWGSTAEDMAIKNALKNFMAANPDIIVEPMYLPGDLDGSTYNAKMTAMAASGTLPDLGYFRPEEFGNYATKGYFLDMTELAKRDNMIESALPQAWLSIDGKIYGAYTAAECQVMWYNKKVLQDAGIPTPPKNFDKGWNWDEFTGYLKKITVDSNGKHPGEAGFNPKNIKRYGVVYDLWNAMYYPMLWSNGGGVISDDGKNIVIDSSESIEVFQKLADLMNKDYVMPYMGSGSGLPSPSVMLANGQLGFWVTGQWTLLDLGQMKDLPLGVAALPILKKPAQIYVSGVNVIFKTTKHPDAAWALQKWMMDPEKTLGLYTSGLWMPTKASYYTDPVDLAKWLDNPIHPEGFKEAVVDSMRVSKNEPIKIKNINNIWGDYLNPVIESIWIGKDSADNALKEAAKKVRASGLLQGTF